jgi:hypothetical protein
MREPISSSGSCTAQCRRTHQVVAGLFQFALLADVCNAHVSVADDVRPGKTLVLALPHRFHPLADVRRGFP